LCGPVSVEHGGPVDVEVEQGRIIEVLGAGESLLCDDDDSVELDGAWILPAFIDSHVHFAYYPVAEELARGGVAAAVDLAAPIEYVGQTTTPVRTLWAGPMITAVGGYPTQSWGAGGYGIEVEEEVEARAAVDQLHAAGVSVIKLPLTHEPALSDVAAAAAIERAHALDLPVAVHAMDDADVLRGARLGADILAHVPMRALSEATMEAWRGKSVISTLAAFGSSDTAIQNLAGLREHGVEVLYGTDLGNSRHVGIQPAELEALLAAGMSGRDIVEAGTKGPAARWQLHDLGSLARDQAASLIVVSSDPTADPLTLSEPKRVLIDGQWMEPPVAPPPSIGG
jgi:imidazolonepropionase-like amidohydrolase